MRVVVTTLPYFFVPHYMLSTIISGYFMTLVMKTAGRWLSASWFQLGLCLCAFFIVNLVTLMRNWWSWSTSSSGLESTPCSGFAGPITVVGGLRGRRILDAFGALLHGALGVVSVGFEKHLLDWISSSI